MTILRQYLSAKIHRATVTHANLDYEGSVTIPPDLLELSGIAEFEAVHIWNVTSGTRLQTYAITGEAGSRDICVNGAAAHLVKPGDKVIIASFCQLDQEAALDFKPVAIFVDENNNVVSIRPEVPGPRMPLKI